MRLVALLEPQISMDDARRILKPGEDPEPPAHGFILTDPNPKRGGRGKSKDSGCNDLNIDLSALFAFTDEP